MGGTDDPSNLIELTTEEHAEAHRLLWEEHGSIYDKIAWRCLSGQISNEEANIEATKAANTGRKCSEKNKQLFRELFSGENNSRYGTPRSEEEKRRISEGTKKAMVGVECGRKKGCVPWNKGKKIGPQSEESKKKKSETMKERWRHKKGGE
jgi:hypothetical protein